MRTNWRWTKSKDQLLFEAHTENVEGAAWSFHLVQKWVSVNKKQQLVFVLSGQLIAQCPIAIFKLWIGRPAAPRETLADQVRRDSSLDFGVVIMTNLCYFLD